MRPVSNLVARPQHQDQSLLPIDSARTMRRSVSLLLYLTADDYGEADGGALRVLLRKPSGPEYVDIPPRAGSLVLFDSATVRHAVMRCTRERLVVVGWLHQPWTKEDEMANLRMNGPQR